VEEVQGRGEPVEIVLYPDAVHAFDAPNMPVRERKGAKTGFGTAPLVGTNEKARQAAIKAVLTFLAEHR
jgi:dienelactone hydrolase